jgi:hypothetical protein
MIISYFNYQYLRLQGAVCVRPTILSVEVLTPMAHLITQPVGGTHPGGTLHSAYKLPVGGDTYPDGTRHSADNTASWR